MSSHVTASASRPRLPLLFQVWRQGRQLAAMLDHGMWPWFDLVLRSLIALYWVSGAVMMAQADQAGSDLPVEMLLWVHPLGIMASLLLIVGLGTRVAAAVLIGVAVGYMPWDVADPAALGRVILLGWYIIVGAGTLSIDDLLENGLAATAVPFARPIGTSCGWIARHLGPVYLFLIRIATAWVVLQGHLLSAGQDAAGVLGVTLLVLGGSLAFGLFTRLVALGLIVTAVVLGGGMALAFDLQLYWLLMLGVLVTIGPGWLGRLIVTAVVLGGGMALAFDLQLYWLLMLGVLVTIGPGWLSLDHALRIKMGNAGRAAADRAHEATGGMRHVVIVGAGFGGLAAAQKLAGTACRVTLIDRRNYHLFQPLLYQVATAVLRSPSDIAQPIRGLFRKQDNVQVLMSRVTDIDTDQKRVVIGDEWIGYDYLVLATGARHSYFGNEQWAPFAPGLKKIDDATDIRRRLLLAFEQAESAKDKAQRQAYLTFVIIGGGPTGVETAGAIAELAHHGMQGEFREVDPKQARIVLIQGASSILPTFSKDLSEYARRALEDLGVEVRTGAVAEDVDLEGVTVAGERIASKSIIWAAGVIASPAGKWLDAETDRAGRVKVGPDLSVPGHPDVFVVGDTALSESWDGKAMPGTGAGCEAKRCLCR